MSKAVTAGELREARRHDADRAGEDEEQEEGRDATSHCVTRTPHAAALAAPRAHAQPAAVRESANLRRGTAVATLR